MEPYDWLMAGDPGIRWQTMALRGESGAEIAAERAKVATEGWGAALLSRQEPAGGWGGGIYSPKWISTTYTLLLLWGLGLEPEHPAGRRGVERLTADLGSVAGAPRVRSPEACVTSMYVGLAAYFGVAGSRLDTAASWLLGDGVMPDGGWNCEAARSRNRHSSFHTTIQALEALAELRRHRPDPLLDERLEGGRRFLLAHRMFRSHRTGEVVDRRYLRFSYPPRWHYDVLRGLAHLADVDAPPDPACAEAITLVRRQRHADGRWSLGPRWPGKAFLELEQPRQPSRWNTLRALRALDWWQRAGPGGRHRGR